MVFPIMRTAKPIRLAALSLSLAGSLPAFAQQSPAPAAAPAEGIPTVVVTAQKREQNVQDVGIPISTLTGDQLERLDITSPAQIPEFTSGVRLAQPNGTGSYSFSIRGVTQNDFADHQESPAAIYVDGAYVSQMTGLAFQMFDLDRVEVLRGPQGTLFGRNATAGLAQFISRAPTVDPEAYLKATIGSYAQFRTEGAVSGALFGNDKILGRLSFQTERHDPLFANPNGGPELENGDEKAYRAQLLFKLPGDSTLQLIARQGNQDVRAGAWESVPSTVGPDGYGFFSGNANALGYSASGPFKTIGEASGHARIDTLGDTAKLDIPVERLGATFTQILDFQHIRKSYLEDSDTTPLPVFEFFNGSQVSQYSSETRLAGDAGGIKWIGGFYYLQIDGTYTEGAQGSAYGGLLYDPYSLRTESYAAFVQGEAPITDRLSVTSGLRYTFDQKDISYQSSYPGFSYKFGPGTVGSLSHLENDLWSGKVELDYKLDKDLLAYASYNRGVKGGGFNAPLDPTPITANGSAIPFKPEELDDYEVGLKSGLLDNHLQLNTSLFYYDYHNYQALYFINLTQIVSNAPARYFGGEIEAQYAPNRAWYFSGNVSYSEGIVRNIDLNGQGAHDYTPANAPKWGASAIARYTVPVNPGQLSFQLDGNYVSSQFYALTNAGNTRQNAYALANARLNYLSDDGTYEFDLAVENLTDKHYATMAFDLAGFLGLAQRYPGRPRWVSAGLTYHF
jgi:iron complex outermembrane receptor protein